MAKAKKPKPAQPAQPAKPAQPALPAGWTQWSGCQNKPATRRKLRVHTMIEQSKIEDLMAIFRDLCIGDQEAVLAEVEAYLAC